MATTAVPEEQGKVLGYLPSDTPPVGSMISLGVRPGEPPYLPEKVYLAMVDAGVVK